MRLYVNYTLDYLIGLMESKLLLGMYLALYKHWKSSKFNYNKLWSNFSSVLSFSTKAPHLTPDPPVAMDHRIKSSFDTQNMFSDPPKDFHWVPQNRPPHRLKNCASALPSPPSSCILFNIIILF